MDNYVPNMYKKTIADIDYSKLKDMGISCLIFDLDNTIALIHEEKISSKTKKLLDYLVMKGLGNLGLEGCHIRKILFV